MNKSQIHLIVAGGRKLFREGLSLLLEKQPNFAVIGDAEDIRDVPRLVAALRVQIVVLNLSRPSLDDTNLIRCILRARPQVRLILLTLSPTVDYVQELISVGAAACLTKESAGEELVEAVERVSAGEVFLSPALRDRIVNQYIRPKPLAQSEQKLAPREREVLRMIAAGQSAKEIAATLDVSCKTIETHRRRLMHKLNRHSVAELTKYAVMTGLTPLEAMV